MTDSALINVLREIRGELRSIRKIMQMEKAPNKIQIGQEGVTVIKEQIPDLETYFEEMEERREQEIQTDRE